MQSSVVEESKEMPVPRPFNNFRLQNLNIIRQVPTLNDLI
jgi:hypothetical protein